jgi:hypothetical protein
MNRRRQVAIDDSSALGPKVAPRDQASLFAFVFSPARRSIPTHISAENTQTKIMPR